MSTSDDVVSETRGGGIVGKVFAAIGVIATVVVATGAALPFTAQSTKDCIGRGEPALVCAAGTMGLVDLSMSAEKDRALEAANAEVAAKAAAASELEKRVGDLDGRVKELEGALGGAKAAATEVERLKGEIARRDARISELTDRLAGPRKPEPAPAAGARPVAPAPVPRPAPKP